MSQENGHSHVESLTVSKMRHCSLSDESTRAATVLSSAMVPSFLLQFLREEIIACFPRTKAGDQKVMAKM